MQTLFSLKKTTALLLIATFVAGSSLTPSQAYADHKHRNKQWQNNHHNQQPAPRQRHRKRNRSGDLIAAGIIGLALGAIIVDSTHKRSRVKQNYNYPSNNSYNSSYRRSYIPDQNTYILPKGSENYNNEDVITYEESASLEPWTPGWQEYCSQRYRSFNPQSGTYKGYDGLHHFCVAK